jgi:polyhydroxybutyrate depolymerase
VQPEVTRIPPAVPDDGTNAIRFVFSNGTGDTAVVSYVIEHGGHTWPGPGHQSVPNSPYGRTSTSVDATKEILAFFDQHPKP